MAVPMVFLQCSNRKKKFRFAGHPIRFPFPLAANKRTVPFAVCSKQTEVVIFHSFPFPCVCMCTCMLPFQTENGSPGNFLNQFIICSLCKRKFVVFPFVDEETNRHYPSANGLNGQNRLDHLSSSI
jgi:hypothetical protein